MRSRKRTRFIATVRLVRPMIEEYVNIGFVSYEYHIPSLALIQQLRDHIMEYNSEYKTENGGLCEVINIQKVGS